MISLDTSALFAILNRGAPDHELVRAALVAERRPYVVPAATLGELAYLIERRLTPAIQDTLLSDLVRGSLELDCGERDLVRVQTLVRRYRDLRLGFVDAAVIACAERHGGRLLTLDLRHFGVVAREGTISVVP